MQTICHFLETVIVSLLETMTMHIKIHYHIVYRINREYFVLFISLCYLCIIYNVHIISMLNFKTCLAVKHVPNCMSSLKIWYLTTVIGLVKQRRDTPLFCDPNSILLIVSYRFDRFSNSSTFKIKFQFPGTNSKHVEF